MTTSGEIERERSQPPRLIACWSCKGPLAEVALFCHTCGAVQPPGNLEHFARLGMAPTFDLDVDRLEKQYLGFQRLIHPDRFVGKPAKERMIAESQAVSLNQAYETLKDPLRRAAYLLELKGRTASVAKDQTVNDPTLLTEAMEARERLAEAESVEAVEALQVEAGAQAISLLADISTAFADDNLDAANRLTTRLKYLRKYLEDTRARRVALETF